MWLDVEFVLRPRLVLVGSPGRPAQSLGPGAGDHLWAAWRIISLGACEHAQPVVALLSRCVILASGSRPALLANCCSPVALHADCCLPAGRPTEPPGRGSLWGPAAAAAVASRATCWRRLSASGL